MKFKYGNISDALFNRRQLSIGIKTEMEHTYSRSVAKKIAKAHLHENPRYYTKLRKAGL